MPKIVQVEETIAAPIDLIWEIMLDLQGYSAWNPFITRVLDGERISAVGQRFRLSVTWTNGKGAGVTQLPGNAGILPACHQRWQRLQVRNAYSF